MMIFYFYLILNLFMVMFIIFPYNKNEFHPLSMNLILILLTFFMCLNMNFLNKDYWYSYILYLLMIGGVMILFMYFTSIASNEYIFVIFKELFYYFLKFFLMFILIIYTLNIEKIKNNSFLDIFGIIDWMFLVNDSGFKNLFMDSSMDLSMLMMLYLFLTMISCVLICFKDKIPLRQMI